MSAILTLAIAIGSPVSAHAGSAPPALGWQCGAPAGPEYYAVELVTTKNIPGTGYARGVAEVAASGASPFSVQLGEDGSYVYDVSIALDRMKPPAEGQLVAWVTTTDLAGVQRLGALDANLRTTGSVSWNQFLVVVTLETSAAPEAAAWQGPVVLRGMSRSGMLHTMVGHGAFQQENCAMWGYAN
jgi:hypothetical protein